MSKEVSKFFIISACILLILLIPSIARAECGDYCKPCNATTCETCCYSEGSVKSQEFNASCCQGLKTLDYYDENCLNDKECGACKDISKNVCAACGNGVCGAGENPCNCPEDCKKAIEERPVSCCFLGICFSFLGLCWYLWLSIIIAIAAAVAIWLSTRATLLRVTKAIAKQWSEKSNIEIGKKLRIGEIE